LRGFRAASEVHKSLKKASKALEKPQKGLERAKKGGIYFTAT
jgi:hypothetical protein